MKFSVLLLTIAALAQGAGVAPDASAELIDFERARLAAFAKADKAAFDQMVADDATMVHSSGGTSTKAEMMEVMRPSTPENPLPTLSIEEPKARFYGDAAVLTGLLVETAKDGRRELVLRFTNTYIRANARWQMVAGQLTKTKP